MKKKLPGKFRVIHDLSSPFEGISVNSCIPTKDGTVMYDTVDTAIQLIQRAGQRAILAKTDIEHAYKLICKDLGIPVVEEKTEKGACIVFLGVTLDSIKMEARLLQDKLDHCLLLVREYLARSHIMVSQLESLTGLLNFACRVLAPGRPFL